MEKEYYTLEERATIRREEKELISKSLKHLCTKYLKYKDWDKIHTEITNFLDKSKKQYKLIMVGRGHLKSSIVTIGYTIQQILKNHNKRILIANAIWDNARGFLDAIKKHLEESDLKDVYGNFKPNTRNARGWNRDAVIINQKTTPTPESTITATGIERTQTSQHYDLIILDDIVVRENISTKEQRDKVRNFYKDCISLLEPDGEVVVIGTTWHEDDLYNDILHDPENNKESDTEYDIFIKPACDPDFSNIVFPKKFNKEILMSIKKKLGPFQFASQYLLNPYPDDDMQFSKQWIKYWHEYPQEDLFISTVLDPSLGKETSDYMGITTTGVNAQGTVYVLEARKFKCKVDLVPEEVLKTINMYKPNVFAMEEFAFQGILKESIRDAFKKARVETYLDELPKHTHISKDMRIRAIIPHFANGYIMMNQSQTDLYEQIVRWRPNQKNREDDIIDSLAYQKKYWSRTPDSKRDSDRELKENSFGYLVEKMRNNHRNDIMDDFRKTPHEENNIAILR